MKIMLQVIGAVGVLGLGAFVGCKPPTSAEGGTESSTKSRLQKEQKEKPCPPLGSQLQYSQRSINGKMATVIVDGNGVVLDRVEPNCTLPPPAPVAVKCTKRTVNNEQIEICCPSDGSECYTK